MAKMELVGKLTPKALGWDRNALGAETARVPADGGKVAIGRIVGIVAGFRETVNQETGDVMRGLKGNFRGISSKRAQVEKTNPKTGEVVMKDGKPVMEDGDLITVTSGVCYLPGGIQDMIEGAYMSAREADAKATVSFAIDLFGIPSTNKAGYSFKADNIVEASAVDPLAMLLEQADANVKSLAAPATETDTSNAPELDAKGGKPE